MRKGEEDPIHWTQIQEKQLNHLIVFGGEGFK